DAPMSPRTLPLVLLLAAGLPSCDDGPTPSEPAKPEATKTEAAKPEPAKPEPAKPEPTKPELAKPEPEPAKPEPAKPPGFWVEHSCRLHAAYVDVTVSVEFDEIGQREVVNHTRKMFAVHCAQCVGEALDYEGCKENSWSCQATRLDLDALDRGEPLRGDALSSGWSVKPVEQPKQLREEIDWTLAHLDDPERFIGMRRSGVLEDYRALARRIQAMIPTLEATPTKSAMGFSDERKSVLLELEGSYSGILSIQDGMVRLLTKSPLALGEASCTGTHGPHEVSPGAGAP
ncbi:MAG: hypothetical protein KDK70_36300, partial [Myxococcales bacterium]|nr:hypothetical protein [Myxococcales bacterium]